MKIILTLNYKTVFMKEWLNAFLVRYAHALCSVCAKTETCKQFTEVHNEYGWLLKAQQFDKKSI